MLVVVLDSLFESLDVERAAAARLGADLVRWTGDPSDLHDADVVAHVRARIDANLIAQMPRCRAIARFGTGLDTVDVDAARRAGIEVIGVRDYCIPELCAQTLVLAFALVRHIRELAGRDGSWEELVHSHPISRHGTAAVVGLGSIGRSVASALIAIGFEVLAVTEHGAESAKAMGAAVMPLDAALGRAEIVFLHAALSHATAEMIDDRRLRLMRPNAILVNTARIGLLDEAATAAALDEHRLGGLALDALLDSTSPLRRFADDPRVLITPHLGWYSEESARTLRVEAINKACQLVLRPKHREA